jgi:hypothetical protein
VTAGSSFTCPKGEPLSFSGGDVRHNRSVTTIPSDDPLALAVVDAIRTGAVAALKRLLEQNPGLATVRLGNDGTTTRSLLHIVADWPGHFPNAATTVQVLVDAGADVNAACTGPHAETPLHWAASGDDVAVLDALLDTGADIEAPGGLIASGTPIADATAFGQWTVAWRPKNRGARTNLWECATLGLMDRVETYFAAAPPAPEAITEAFWGACHGGQLVAAEYLLERGADINWVGYDDLTPLDAARRSEASDVVEWLIRHGAKPASEPGERGQHAD